MVDPIRLKSLKGDVIVLEMVGEVSNMLLAISQ